MGLLTKRLNLCLIVASLCLASYCASAYAKEVVVTGRGATMGLAHSDACRNAVEKALGVYIRSETRVKNHQLISDKILSVAEGYIRKIDFLEGGCKAGSCFVQIRAEVNSVAIRTALIKNHIEVIDGEQTYSRVETEAERMRNRIETCRDELGSLEYPRSFIFVSFNYQIYPDADRKGYAILELSNILARSAKLHLLNKWYGEAIRTKNRGLLKELSEHGFPSVFTGPFDPIGGSEYPLWTFNVELYDKKGRIIKKLTTTRDYDYDDENVNLLKTYYTYKTGSRECVDNGINCIQSGPWPAESSRLSDRRYSVPMSVIRKTQVIKAFVESPLGENSWASEPRLRGRKDNKAVKELTATDWFEKGLAFHRKDESDKAIADYTKVIELDPQYVVAYYNRGLAYKYKGEYDKAIADYNKVLELDPQYADAYSARGNAYQAKGEYDKAIADYNKALELDPKDSFAYNNRGLAYKYKGQYDKAIADYNKALELNPQYADAYDNRGNVYRDRGEYDKAIAEYYKAVWWEPQYADAYYDRGAAYRYKGEYDKAIADFNKVLELDPQDAYAYKHRGHAYSEKGEYTNAIADFNSALELDPQDAYAYKCRGNAYSEKGEDDKAITDFNKALELNPQYAVAYYNRGLTYRKQGEFDKAIADFNKLLELDPQDANAYFFRGYTYSEKGELDKAIADYSKALELRPEEAVYYFRGLIYKAKGECDKAIADFSQALELDPKHANAYKGRGQAYCIKGQYDKAITDFNKLLKLDPQNAKAYFFRGYSYSEKGEYDKAIADYSKALELDPRDADAYYSRGIAHDYKTEYDKAIADYDKALKINPKDASVYNSLAWILSTCSVSRFRDGKRAVSLSKEAIKLSQGKYEYNYLDTLAAALAEVGKFEEAIKTQERAISLLKKEGRADSKEYYEHLIWYKAGRAWRDEANRDGQRLQGVQSNLEINVIP